MEAATVEKARVKIATLETATFEASEEVCYE